MSPPLLRGRDLELALHEIRTPEGVPLHFGVARVGDRLAAFTLDYMIVLGLTIGLILIAVLAGVILGSGGWIGGFALLALFLLENFYFTWFEIRWRGATPGKRAMKTRVIDARGGPLRADAVFVRNITRNIEIFIPLSVALAPRSILPDAPGWAVLLAIGWLLVLGFIGLFNRDRRRIGDLLAGTMVVRAPKSSLDQDLSRTPAAATAVPEAVYSFRREQLEFYGIYELQVLEDVLRTARGQSRESLALVCDRIKRKIGWDPGDWNVTPYRFLMDFYAAQRRHLEQRMLMGQRKESKTSRTPPPT